MEGSYTRSAMSRDPLDEALDLARQGDERGATTLFRALNPGLVRYLRHHARGAEEDLASEVWSGVATLLPQFRGDARAFRTALFMLARRRTVDHYRRKGRAPSFVPLDEADEPFDALDVERAVLSGLSTQRAIAVLVDRLPPKQAEVVLLRVVGDLGVDEVAEIVGRSPGAVRVLQHRALQRLARELKKVVTR